MKRVRPKLYKEMMGFSKLTRTGVSETVDRKRDNRSKSQHGYWRIAEKVPLVVLQSHVSCISVASEL